jgi:phenylalanyl-tRNA synthetase beta chain
MKLSVAWIFDHIATNWHTVDITALLAQLNQRSTETDACYPVNLDKNSFTHAQVVTITPDNVTVQLADGKTTVQLPARTHCKEGHWYILKKDRTAYRWATATDFGSSKDHILPAILVDPKNPATALDNIEWNDHIIEVDNKAISHRPDLWGHRGFAQEIAILLDLKLKPIEEFLANVPLEIEPKKQSPDFPFAITVDTKKCNRFAACYLPAIKNTPSLPKILARLCRIDARPIDAYVDATNYVMNDVGQPMHVFDGKTFDQKSIIVRNAKAGEKLTLLDGQTIECTPGDIVIANPEKVLSLAGIMGGKDSCFAEDTTSCIAESAHFDSTTIRLSSLYHKKRTDASSRFEKYPDPNQNITAMQRFLKLLADNHLITSLPATIVSWGKEFAPSTITVNHSQIEATLGVTLKPEFIETTLQKLGFMVTTGDGVYTILVPTSRSTKDVTITEDIIEEVGRLYGYQQIQPVAPRISAAAYDTQYNRIKQSLTQFLAFGLRMHEIKSYAFFDAQFLSTVLKWEEKDIEDLATVQSAVSQNWSQLATTLMPTVLKAIHENHADHDQFAFFEVGRVWHSLLWHTNHPENIIESKKMVLAWYGDSDTTDFYSGKQNIDQIAQLCGLQFEWSKLMTSADSINQKLINDIRAREAKLGLKPEEPGQVRDWFKPYQSADLLVEDPSITNTIDNRRRVGTAGIISPLIKERLQIPAKKNIFLAEFYLDELIKVSMQSMPKMRKINKYPAVSRDFTVVIEKSKTIASFMSAVKQSDTHITNVSSMGFFIKNNEGLPTRNITIRVTFQDENKTLEAREIEAIVNNISTEIAKWGTVA